MKNNVPAWSFVIPLLLAGAPALAATATAISYVDRSFNPNASAHGTTTCDLGYFVAASACDLVIEAPLVVTDPDGVRSQVTFQHELFSPTNTGLVPNRVLSGSAMAYALPGSLHAGVEVLLEGFGNHQNFTGGVSGYGYAFVEDRITVTSATLAKKTPVVLTTQLAVNGMGCGSVGLMIRGSRPGLPGLSGVFGGSDSSNSNLTSMNDISGQFTAYVGETLWLEYYLRASAGVSNSGWAQIDVLNGRAARSLYGNSAYLYFGSAEPDVQWVADSGATYRVAVVPEPSTFAMLLLGLVALGAIAKRESNPATQD